MGRENLEKSTEADWGPLRIVYLLYPSDAIVFFSSDLWFKRPDWLISKGPEISPYMEWYPFITFLQVGIDMLFATNVTNGYGHTYSAEDYIDAWTILTDPVNFDDDQIKILKNYFLSNMK